MTFILTKKDMMWAYFAQFFQVAAGVLILPLVLKLLNSNEVGLYYLMLNVGALVLLFDFGFSSQFTRVFSYIFSGAQNLLPEGLDNSQIDSNNINYKLLKNVIQSSRFVYRFISLIVLLIMLSLGTLYIYRVTDKFTLIKNTPLIWVLYSISIFLNMYYSYLTPLLIGKGDITGSRKAIVYSKVIFILISLILLCLGLNLLSIVIANLIAPFVQRGVSRKYIFTYSLNIELKKYNITRAEIIKRFREVWYNAKRMGLVMLGSFAINKTGMLFAGVFLPLVEVASFGLMQQIVGLIFSISSTMFVIHQPRFAGYLIQNKKNDLLKEFSLTAGVFYLLYFIGSILLILVVPVLLRLIGSNTILPSTLVLIGFCIITFLEQNHSMFATLITISNKVPFVKPSLIAGLVIIVGTYISLAYTNIGMWALIVVPGFVQLAYANWKWPLYIFKEYDITVKNYIKLVYCELVNYLKELFNELYRLFKK